MLEPNLIDTAKRIDMIDFAKRYVELKHKCRDEWAGPCPLCNDGEDRFTVRPDGWFCRVCHPIEKAEHGWYSVVDFVMAKHRLQFTEAIAFLTGATINHRAPALRAKHKPLVKQPQPEGWRIAAERIADQAQTALLDGDNPGAAYLTKRGLGAMTWQMFGMGFGQYRGQAAIVLPWYRGGKIVAIRYRFIDVLASGAKIKSEPDSDYTGLLYGGPALLGGAERVSTLVLCEGELNAASIWQVAYATGLDVLSVGGESTKITKPMVDYAAQYRHVIVWMDKPVVAQVMAKEFPGASSISSPVTESKPKGIDANDMLQMGVLGEFLTAVRVKACRNVQDKERLLWGLWDAAQGEGIDAGTEKTGRKLATELGKEW